MCHLSTLVDRIERMEQNHEYQKDPLFRGRLLNIVEYMTYSSDWTKEEAEAAHKVLDKYDFSVGFNHKAIESELVKMRGLPDVYRETCMRCGRHLSNPYSIKKGMGPKCRAAAARGDWGSDDNPPQPGVAKMQGIFGPEMGQQKMLKDVCDYPLDCKVD